MLLPGLQRNKIDLQTLCRHHRRPKITANGMTTLNPHRTHLPRLVSIRQLPSIRRSLHRLIPIPFQAVLTTPRCLLGCILTRNSPHTRCRSIMGILCILLIYPHLHRPLRLRQDQMRTLPQGGRVGRQSACMG